MNGTTVAAWQQEIDGRLQTLSSAAPGKRPWLYVVVDRATPLERLLPLFGALGARYELQLVVEPDAPPAGPAPAGPGAAGGDPLPRSAGRTGRRLDRAGEAVRSRGLRRHARLPDGDAVNEAKATPPPERARHFVRLLVGMTRDCGCARVDVDAVEYMAIDMFSGFKTPRRVLRVQPAPDAPALALPPGPVTGQSLVTALDRVTKPGQPLRIRLPGR